MQGAFFILDPDSARRPDDFSDFVMEISSDIPIFIIRHLHFRSHRDFMNRRARVARYSSEGNIRRQILVAAARAGSARPNASTTSQPSYCTSLSVLKV